MDLFISFIIVAVLTIIIEWCVVLIMTKTRLIDKFLPKQNAKNSYIQFKSGGIDAHFEGNINDAIKTITNFFFTEQTTEQKIDNKIDNAINKNTDKIIDIMLSNKNIQKQMQKQIFNIVKDKLNIQMQFKKNNKKVV